MTNVIFREAGVIILATSSSVPGVMIVPPNKTVEDGELVTHEEFKEILDTRELEAVEQALSTPDLTETIGRLQSEIETLKAKGN